MNKRRFLAGAALIGASATSAFAAKRTETTRGAKCPASPVVLTVTGAIKQHNRGGLDPAFDQLLSKHQVKFSEAYGVDLAMLDSMPAVTIHPTTEYDSHQHALRGPLLTDLLERLGAPDAGSTRLVLHAVDGYAVMTTLDKVRAYRFIVATQMDGKPLPLGGVGPLWAVYDADSIPELSNKPLKDRFELSPWGFYHLQVTEA